MRYTIALAVSATVFLTACGGSGGGSSSTLAPFVDFRSIAIPGTTRVTGSSQEATYTYNTTTQTVTSVSPVSAAAAGTFDVTYAAGRSYPTRMVINTGGGTNVTLDASRGDTFGPLAIDQSVSVAVSANGQNYVLVGDPFQMGWNYQSFGVWVTGGGTGSGTVGAMSAGAATSAAALPTTGTATYSGFAGGRYVTVNAAGADFWMRSSMTAVANFAARSIAFSTSGTQITPDLVTLTNRSNLNMTGTLTYSPGSNQFAGAVSTAGGLTGNATGQFYGPAAQEIGGTFTLRSGNEGMLGAFGGARP